MKGDADGKGKPKGFGGHLGGGGYDLFVDPVLLQTGGTVAVGPHQGSGYEQPDILTYIFCVSSELNQPFPASILLFDPELGVNVGPGNVTIAPVGVYAGRDAMGPPLEILVGGHCNVAVCTFEPAPVPPVCQGFKGGVQGLVSPQVPEASLGSFGIQPFSNPSW